MLESIVLARRLLLTLSIGLLGIFILLHNEISMAHALVVTAPRWDIPRTRTNGMKNIEKSILNPDLELRVRTTSPEDIAHVAIILSLALVDKEMRQSSSGNPIAKTTFNFKRKVEFLRTKAGVVSLLLSRMEAIRIGKSVFRGISQPSVEELNNRESLRLLWSNDNFRIKLEKASKLSDEPHAWKNHNFACPPQNSDVLFHKMLTAENIATGEIVGFCELAMLSQPKNLLHGEDEEANLELERPVPTVVNLVTSPDYRRRGIASTILRSASRFVQKQWSYGELALYVDQNNFGAVRMYERLGFETKCDSGTNQLYMKAGLSIIGEGTKRAMLHSEHCLNKK